VKLHNTRATLAHQNKCSRTQEASDNVISLRDDDPDHFELLLRYIYTNHYDTEEIAKRATDDATLRVLIPMGVSAVADKYEVDSLYEHAVADVRALLSTQDSSDFKLLRAAITAYYSLDITMNSSMGDLIVSIVLNAQRGFMSSANYQSILRMSPTFAVDIALGLSRNTINAHCNRCRIHVTMQLDAGQQAQEVLKREIISCNLCGYCITGARA
jgi:hypothetical protein